MHCNVYNQLLRHFSSILGPSQSLHFVQTHDQIGYVHKQSFYLTKLLYGSISRQFHALFTVHNSFQLRTKFQAQIMIFLGCNYLASITQPIS